MQSAMVVAASVQPMDWDQVQRDMKMWEKDVPHMYLDTRHNVTVAVGHLLATAAEAQRFGFVDRVSGAAVGAADIAADFAAVDQQEEGHLDGYYRKFTKLDLPSPQRTAILQRDIEMADQDVGRYYAGYSGYPLNVRRALIDMRFNLGPLKFAKYTVLRAACERGDWQAAAAECRRIGISEPRNEWTRQLFLQP